jgi:hypothetical protein
LEEKGKDFETKVVKKKKKKKKKGIKLVLCITHFFWY